MAITDIFPSHHHLYHENSQRADSGTVKKTTLFCIHKTAVPIYSGKSNYLQVSETQH